MFSDFIKHYNIIREILRDVFLYGCFSIEDLEQKKKISSRKISYEIRRIQQYVQQDFVRADRDGRYKLLSLTYDSITYTNNFLVDTYMTKSFTRSDLVLYFYILMILNDADKELSFREIEDLLIEKEILSYDNISSKTIERKLAEMSNRLGVLTQNKIKRTNYYSIADDVFKTLDDNGIRALIVAVSLFKNLMFPITLGYNCEQSLLDYAAYERGIEGFNIDYFQYRNLHFHPVIEEQVLWEMLKAIHEKKCITLDYKQSEEQEKVTTSEILRPYKIRYDINYGRFYLLSYNYSNKPVLSRLDRTDSVKILSDTFDQQSLEKFYDRDMRYSWSSVPISANKIPEKIVLEIIFDESTEAYILEKIKSEIKECTTEKIDTGRYRLEMFVNDSLEMVPWIRSYSGYIKIIQGRKIKSKLAEDWKEVLETYGVF